MKAARNMKAILSAALVSTVVISTVACSTAKPAESGTSDKADASAQQSKIVELKAITMGTEPQTGMDKFYEQLDALTKKDLGAIVRFTFIPWGDEKNQISRAIAAKEYDIYVGGAWTDFKNFAVKNAFVDLKPMLAKVPKLAEHYGDVLQRAEIDGKLYGIPQLNKPGAGGEGILYREDLRKKWGLPEVEDMDSLEKYLYKAKQEFPDTPMINDQRVGDKIFQLIAGNKYLPSITSMQGTALTVGTYDNPFKAISIYDTPEYKQAVTIAKKWYDDGIIAHDILASQGNETDKTKQLMLAGKKPLEFSNHFGAVSTAYIPALKKDHPDWEFGWLDIGFDMFPNSVRLPAVSAETATMMSIGANSKYPEIALKLIEKAHTDRTYYDLLQYGVQGVHYNKQGDSINYTGIDDKNRKPGWTGLVDGYMNYQEKYPGEWQAISDKLGTEGPKLAVKNGPSPYEGFVFNTADLSAELSSLQTARTQYVLPLQTGVVKKSVDSDLDTAKQQLKGAGLDKYMAALQKQLDAFAASKKK